MMITEFILNNKLIKTPVKRGTTLLDFIRYEQRLSGTKIGCREGDCGACTVLIGELIDDRMRYQSMTSCITPLGNARNKHVVTIEGLNMDELTPVQKAMIDESGTQCGFCTVGFVVSLSSYCLTAEKPTLEGAISNIDGNICRCTGYKSIERAADKLVGLLSDKNLENPVEWLVQNKFIPDYFLTISERITTLNNPKPSLTGRLVIGGGTDLYVQRHDDMTDEEIGLVLDRSEMRKIEVRDGQVFLGSATTASDIMYSPVMNGLFPNLWKHLKLVSSTPIRNMGTVAGNFVNASPIGDLTAFFLALNSSVYLKDQFDNIREIKLKEFYLGYKVLNKKADEVVAEISFPIPETGTKFNFEKVCKRTYLDIASVNSAIQIRVEAGTIQHVHLSAGGVGSTPKYLEKTCTYLTGKHIKTDVLAQANEMIQSEISPISDVRGTKEYKRLLLRQLFLSHFIELYPEYIQAEELV